jgi:ribose-phosphate pyrophosphokinase
MVNKNKKEKEVVMNNHHGPIKLLTGSSYPELAQRIADNLSKLYGEKVELVKTDLGTFDGGEIKARVTESVRGCDVFFFQSLHSKGNISYIEETEFIIDCIKDSASRITGIFPWISYAKQDRKTKPRESRSFKVIARRLSQCGLDRIVLFDIHNSATEGFFSIPVDRIYLMKLLIEDFQKRNLKENFAIGSPDEGSVKRASTISDLLDLDSDICVVTKYRNPKTKEVDIKRSKVLGDVKGKTIFFFDDMIQKFTTLMVASGITKEAGAKKIISAAVHPDFTPITKENMDNSPIDEIVVVDTIPINEKDLSDKVRILDPAPFISDSIRRLHADESLSPLFLSH